MSATVVNVPNQPLDPASALAAQAAADSATNPLIRQVIQTYQQTGIVPITPEAIAAINAARAQRGLPPVSPQATKGTPATPGTIPDIPTATGADVPVQAGQVPSKPATPAAPTSPPATPPATTPTTTPMSATPGTPGYTGTDPAAVKGGSVAGTPSDPYVSAAMGDKTALSGVLSTIMQSLGLNPERPGLYDQAIQQQISPYLPLYMALNGVDSSRQAAANYGQMMHNVGGFGALRDWATQQAAGLGDISSDPEQQSIITGLMSMMEAPNSPIRQQVDQAKMNALQGRWQRESLNGPISYVDFLRKYQNEVPNASALLPLLGVTTASRP